MEEEAILRLSDGYTARTPAYPSDCDYVRICDSEGDEVVYWDVKEWSDEPELVMGALFGIMINPKTANDILTNNLNKQLSR